MATKASDDEGWAGLTHQDLSSTDPGVVAQIQSLLRDAQGRPGQNREEFRQRKAAHMLRSLTLNVILINCSSRLGLPKDHPDVTSLADRIFASHAFGAPFIRDGRYKTWAEIWQPERAPFLGLVSITAKSRCKDWLASLDRDPDAVMLSSSEERRDDGARGAIAVEHSRPDLELEFLQVERLLERAIDRLPPGKARNAIRAKVCSRMTAREYAAHVGIKETAAHMQMARGAEKLRDLLVHDGLVSDGFGRNIISVGELTRKVSARLGAGKKL